MPSKKRARTTEVCGEQECTEVLDSDVVKLHVGGEQFTCSAATLTSSEYFRVMLAVNYRPLTRNAEGQVVLPFIDRCPHLFGILLNSMRQKAIPEPRVAAGKKQELIREAVYFGMTWLHEMLLGRVSTMQMRPHDRTIRDQELSADLELIEIFGTSSFECADKDPTELNEDLFYQRGDVARPRFDCADMEAFEKNMDSFTNDLFQALQAAKNKLGGCIIAGGSVTDAIVGGSGRATDLDIFLTTPAAEGMARMEALYDIVAFHANDKRPAHQREPMVMVTRTNSSVTIFNTRYPRPCVQVILHTYSGGVAEILRRFDVDCCCFCYDIGNHKLWCTPRAKRSLEFAANVVESRFDSASYATRLEKYALRHGFAIALPGYRSDLVSQAVLERSYVSAPTYNLVFQINHVGKPEKGEMKMQYAGNNTVLHYGLRHEASLVNGALKWVCQNHPAMVVNTVSTPDVMHAVCPKCEQLQAGAVVIATSGAPPIAKQLFIIHTSFVFARRPPSLQPPVRLHAPERRRRKGLQRPSL